MAPGEELVSDDGRFVLDMQRDGDLVLRGSDGAAVWASGTAAVGSSLVARHRAVVAPLAPAA